MLSYGLLDALGQEVKETKKGIEGQVKGKGG